MVKARTVKNAEVTLEDEKIFQGFENQPRAVEAEGEQEGITRQEGTYDKGNAANGADTVSEKGASGDTDETDATEKTTFMLSPENKKFLQFRKIDGKGSMTRQVNRLIEQARAAEQARDAAPAPRHDTPSA